MLSPAQAAALRARPREGRIELAVGLTSRASTARAAERRLRGVRIRVERALRHLAPGAPVILPDVEDVPCFPIRADGRFLLESEDLREALEAAVHGGGLRMVRGGDGTARPVIVEVAPRRVRGLDRVPAPPRAHAVVTVRCDGDVDAAAWPTVGAGESLRGTVAESGARVAGLALEFPRRTPAWPMRTREREISDAVGAERSVAAAWQRDAASGTLIDAIGRTFRLQPRLGWHPAGEAQPAPQRLLAGEPPQTACAPILAHLVLELVLPRGATCRRAEGVLQEAIQSSLGTLRAMIAARRDDTGPPEARHVPFLPGALADGTPVPDVDALYTLLHPVLALALGGATGVDRTGARWSASLRLFAVRVGDTAPDAARVP